MVFKTNIMGDCPGGLCDYIKDYSEVLVVILCLDGFIFFVTLLPPLFSWGTKKADGRKRIFFAALACFTFYFWLAFLAVNWLYCFGFLAHQGPCKTAMINTSTTSTFGLGETNLPTTVSSSGQQAAFPTLPENNLERPVRSSQATPSILSSIAYSAAAAAGAAADTSKASSAMPTMTTSLASMMMAAAASSKESPNQQMSPAVPMALISWTSDKANSTCVQPANEHETQLKNLTLVNILILVVLFIVFIANAKEAMSAKALYHKETLCKKEEVQRFLSSLVLKPPEVGHLINCFHTAKTNSDTRNKKANIAAMAASLKKTSSKDGGPPRKVVTFSAIENFSYQTWRDFSDLRLIEPSSTYPIIEIEIVLNFFPGDHYTAERYKAFVNQMTKTHSGKDGRITIDDYFHVEDHREWTFFIGNETLINPWWDKDATKVPLSCIFLLGWPFRLAYKGRIAKHQVELKKAVFLDSTSADEGVSLSATPASDADSADKEEELSHEDIDDIVDETKAMLTNLSGSGGPTTNLLESAVALTSAKPRQTSTASSSNHEQFTILGANEHRVNAVVCVEPPPDQLNLVSKFKPTVQALQSVNRLSQQSSDQMQPLKQQQQQQQQKQQQQQQQQQQYQHFYQQMQVGPSLPTTATASGVPINARHPAFGHPLAHVLPNTPPMPPQRSVPLTSPRTHLRETTKDIVTAVTHQDINGVNTVALKDIDVQMTSMSGYETYV